jgi:hypothetical protein
VPVALEVDASFIYIWNGGVGMEERSLTRYLVYQVPGPRNSSPLDVKLCQQNLLNLKPIIKNAGACSFVVGGVIHV